MSDYLYFSNNLKDIKDNMLDYIISCKIFLQEKFNYPFPFTSAFCLFLKQYSS